MEAYVGLDTHSKRSVYAIANRVGDIIARGEVPTTPAGLAALRHEHGLAPGTPVALETGTLAFFVARQLQTLELAQVLAIEELLVPAFAPFTEAVRRLQTIPGVGPIVALTAVAVFSDASRFPSAKHAGELRGARSLDVSIGDTRCTWPHHQTWVRGAAHDGL